MSGSIIQLNEDLIKNNSKDLVRDSVEETLNALLDHEANELVRAGKYERTGDRKGYQSMRRRAKKQLRKRRRPLQPSSAK